MIVFNLICGAAGHVFEAWFGSSADYEDQKARGLLSCPICGDSAIDKGVMAPNIAPKANSRAAPSPAPAPTPTQPQLTNAASPKMAEAMRMLAAAQERMLKGSVWVGKDFTEKARAMHFEEIERATIHGEATPDQVTAMIEDGIELQPLPFPVIPPEAQN